MNSKLNMILFAVILGKTFLDRDHNPPKTRGFEFGMSFAGFHIRILKFVTFIHIQLIELYCIIVFEN